MGHSAHAPSARTALEAAETPMWMRLGREAPA
jgi:hypothetical protein